MTAAFAAFKPAAVESAITGGWTKTSPAAILGARERGATAQLERILGPIATAADIERATQLLFASTEGVDCSGRMLFAGLSALDRPTTPWGALWRAADLVREHRGDGHIAAWIPYLDSTEITMLTELAWEIPPRSYVFTRGWDEAEGERVTDEATRPVLDRLGDRAAELFEILGPWSEAIVAAGGYPASPKNLRVNG